MTNFKLNLPTDIPWERLCVSEDMIDTKVCDKERPLKWRSSIAVFSYEPPEEFQEYDNQIVSYLKVACTITGFQPEGEEVGLNDRRADNAWFSTNIIENYKDIVGKYYECFGAILQVSIAPKDSDIDVENYPYFADFNPKKRELYELVTETGETMSRSLSGVNVRKGTVSTETEEVLDVFNGFSTSGQGSGPGGIGGGGSFSFQGERGTRNISSEEVSNVRTTDRGSENRESYSYTTQLSQMYHQLSSYHIGTNRAVFFQLPRPHIVDAEATFVNGPRKLEGIQEYFLVVVRPKDVEEICVDAKLETAHIVSEPIFEYEKRSASFSFSIYLENSPGSGGGPIRKDNISFKEDTQIFIPEEEGFPGYEIDVEREGGFVIESRTGTRIEEASVTSVSKDRLVTFGRVSAQYRNRAGSRNDIREDGSLTMRITVFLRKKEPIKVGSNQNLILTARDVCCCSNGVPIVNPSLVDYITFETPLSRFDGLNPNEANNIAISKANIMREEIGKILYSSINSVDRYPNRTVGFHQAQCISNYIGEYISSFEREDNYPIKFQKGINENTLAKIESISPDLSKGILLSMSFQEQVDRFDLDYLEALELRSALLGISAVSLPPNQRWDRIPPVFAITHFTLVNAETNTDVKDLNDGEIVNLFELGLTKINIRANTNPSEIGSVKFQLNGEEVRIEEFFPYALYGNNEEDYFEWEPEPGNYQINAIPYSNNGATGLEGKSLSINISIDTRGTVLI